MGEIDGLVCAFVQSTDGWREIGWDEIANWSEEDGLLWVHLNTSGEKTVKFLKEEAAIDPIIAEHLLAEETRPRTEQLNGSTLINLRGVNLNPGADPEDMVAIRLLFAPNRIISTRGRRLLAISDLRERILAGRGPASQGEFIVYLVGRLIERMAPTIERLDDQEDELEERVIEGTHEGIRSKLTTIRRQAIVLRRYLSPQREAMNRLQLESITWLNARQRASLRDTNDKIIRFIEELDAIRERAAIIQDEVMSQMSEQMNRNMYLLSIVATIMLPLGFLTGLLGVNVDGIPGADNSPLAFPVLSIIMLALIVVEVILLKKLKII